MTFLSNQIKPHLNVKGVLQKLYNAFIVLIIKLNKSLFNVSVHSIGHNVISIDFLQISEKDIISMHLKHFTTITIYDFIMQVNDLNVNFTNK